MVRVKICGITNWPDAIAACNLGADALGFNFYKKSPRAISPASAWKIILKLPPFVAPVGVFVNWTPSAVIALAESLRLAAAQLHGDETPADIAAVARRLTVIKAVRVAKGFSAAHLARYRAAHSFLLDAAHTGQYGGTGLSTDWSAARKAANSHRIILAGGLTPENIAAAIRFVRPYAVDVASGVESRPGKKDHGKLRDFFREVDRANRDLNRELSS
jgi:phosphoribosylanthranilate isomerase